MRDRYSIAVGLLFAIAIVVALVEGVGSRGGSTLGLDEKPDRWPLPEFAVPIASSELEGDANVAQDNCETSQLAWPKDAQRTPACQIDLADSIRVCDLFGRPLVLSFWFGKGGDDCVGQQDVVERVRARYRGRVNFLSVDVRDDRETVRDLVSGHGWTMPVGYDHDGAVATLYRVGLCPTFAYAYPGGTLYSASIGTLTDRQLETQVEALLGATQAAEKG